MRIILIWGADRADAGTHPSLLIIPYMQGYVNNYFKKLIHRISTDLSTGALCAKVQNLSPKTKPPWAPKCQN